SLGIFATQMGDLRRVWDAIAPPPQQAGSGRAPRLGYLQDDSMGRVDPRVWERYSAAVDSLRRSGVALTGISIPGFSVAPQVCVSVVYPELASMHYKLVRERPELYSDDIRALFYLGEL